MGRHKLKTLIKPPKNQLIKPNDEPLKSEANIVMPAMMIPGFRTTIAIERGVQHNILFKTWGGLGDQVCAEPTIRFAMDNFKNCEFTIVTEYPFLFRHLPVKEIIHTKDKDSIDWDKYFAFDTIYHHGHLQWEFMIHMNVHCVDYTSLCVFRGVLPNKLKEIVLKPTDSEKMRVDDLFDAGNQSVKNAVVLHCGRHWQSKTFPKWWWDRVIDRLVSRGIEPVLIGGAGPDNSGTVDVNSKLCLDLRNKLSIMESTSLLQRCKVVLTNDSAPLHLAASGDAWIGFIATCKHPDFITHYRNGGQFGYKMQNLGKGGVWEKIDLCPNKTDSITVDDVGDDLLKWLPEPEEFAQWAIEKAAT